MKKFLSMLAALSLVAAACAGGETDGSGEAGGSGSGPVDAAKACNGKTLSFIGLAGEEGEKELANWRKQYNTKLEINSISEWPALFSAIKVGQTYDLATIPYHQAQRMIASGIVQPLDTSRLKHWDEVVPGLRENESLRGEDGKIYGVPMAWGDGPYVYHPDRVPDPPKSITELLDPSWKGRFVTWDDPNLPFNYFAVARGFTKAPLLTPKQLDLVAEDAKKLLDNTAAFNASYEDATDRLVSGDVDLALGGWEAMLTWAEEKGVQLDFDFLKESGGGGWWDGLAIPSTADDVDCAYAYIDAILAPKTQAKIATNLVSGTVNEKAIDKVAEAAQIYDYSLVTSNDPKISFKDTNPPDNPPPGYTSYQDWLDKWQEIKSGA